MELRHTGRPQELTCAEFIAGHSDYLDGALVAHEAGVWQAHMSVCESCARYDRIVRRSLELVHDLPAVEPSAEFELRLQHRLFHLQDSHSIHAPRAGAGAAVALAAAATIAVLAWSPLLFVDGERAESTADVAPYAAAPYAALGVSTPAFGNVWYASPATAVPATRLVSMPGPYSPLIVNPPEHRAGRTTTGPAAVE